MACSNCSGEAFSCSTVAAPMVTPTNLTVGTTASARCTCTAQFKHDMPSIVILMVFTPKPRNIRHNYEERSESYSPRRIAEAETHASRRVGT
jgi:hypothetical protein